MSADSDIGDGGSKARIRSSSRLQRGGGAADAGLEPYDLAALRIETRLPPVSSSKADYWSDTEA